METRQNQLLQLKSYVQNVDTHVTLLLQSLQWDRKHLLEGTTNATCQFSEHHKMPRENLSSHEEVCRLRHLGYTADDTMLPDILDKNATSYLKFDCADIQHIINAAASTNPIFKRGPGCSELPLTLERQQAAYSADERRALYDAVVRSAPACHDLSELALPSTNEENTKVIAKSRNEVLAELRDMKRRRTKYRVAAKTRNYSDVLRDVIKTQMEVYSDVNPEITPDVHPSSSNKISNNARHSTSASDHKINKGTMSDDINEEGKHKNYRRDSSKEQYFRNNLKRRHDYQEKDRENSYYKEDTHKKEREKVYDKTRHKKEREKEYDESRYRRERHEEYESRYKKGIDNENEESRHKRGRDKEYDESTHRRERDEEYESRHKRERNNEYDESRHRKERDAEYGESRHKKSYERLDRMHDDKTKKRSTRDKDERSFRERGNKYETEGDRGYKHKSSREATYGRYTQKEDCLDGEQKRRYK